MWWPASAQSLLIQSGWDVVADLAERGLEVGLQQAVLVARDEVFKGVEHRLLDELGVGIQREHQRQFLLEHQRAAGDGRDDRVACICVARQHRHVGAPTLFHRIQIAQFQLGHAAALLLVDDLIRNLVVVQQLDEVGADAGLVVVDVAGGEDGHLAGRALAVDGSKRGVAHRAAPAKTLLGQAGHPGVGVDTELAVHHLAHGLRLVHRIDHIDDDRDASKLAVHIGAGQELLFRGDMPVLVLDGLGAQHEVRKVHLPRVRWRVRALGHVAQVAQITLVDDAPVGFLPDAVHFTVGGGVHQVEERGEALAQAHAAPAAVADVEHTFHLRQRLALVVEVGILPIDRVAGGGFEIAFTHGVFLVGWAF